MTVPDLAGGRDQYCAESRALPSSPRAQGMGDLTDETITAAFRLLLQLRRPLKAAQIASELNAELSAVRAKLDRLDAAGRIRRTAGEHVVGSAGLSVAPAAHELRLDSRRFWTWCAYDVVGIAGALRADARSVSYSPATGAQIRLQFAAGRPPATPVIVLFPADRGSARTIDDWCSNANFFEAGKPPSRGRLSTRSRERSSTFGRRGAEAWRTGVRCSRPIVESNRGRTMVTTVDVIVIGTG